MLDLFSFYVHLLLWDRLFQEEKFTFVIFFFFCSVRETRCHCEKCTWSTSQTSMGFFSRAIRSSLWLFSGTPFCMLCKIYLISFVLCLQVRAVHIACPCSAVKKFLIDYAHNSCACHFHLNTAFLHIHTCVIPVFANM